MNNKILNWPLVIRCSWNPWKSLQLILFVFSRNLLYTFLLCMLLFNIISFSEKFMTRINNLTDPPEKCGSAIAEFYVKSLNVWGSRYNFIIHVIFPLSYFPTQKVETCLFYTGATIFCCHGTLWSDVITWHDMAQDEKIHEKQIHIIITEKIAS